MKIELGKTYKTRSGNSTYKVVCVDAPGEYPVIAYDVADGVAETFNARGFVGVDENHCGLDLISEVVPKIVRYLNIWSETSTGVLYETRLRAENGRGGDTPIACIRIEYSPGQFDD